MTGSVRTVIRYGIAVTAPLLTLLLRAGIEQAGAPGLPTYITFYPAVMAVAILAGLGPGLAATAVTVAIVDYWVLYPPGFGIESVTDIVGQVLFAAMGTFMSTVAELYRRNRDKASAYEKALVQREGEAQVRRQREWLHVTLTSIGDAVLATDSAGKIAFLNPVAENMTGWQESAALGQPVQSVFRIINEQTRQPGEDIVARVLAEGRIVQLANHTVLVTRDSREVPIEDSAAPIKDATGLVIGTVVVFHDVTEKRRAEQSLLNTVRELKRSNSDLEQFAYIASHDLQEPLRQVRGFVQLLRERYGDRLDGKAEQYMDHVHVGATRMSRLVEDLLAYSRLAAGGERVREAVSAKAALDSALANLQASIEESHARITHDELPTLHADPVQLTQLFQNLIGNAIKFHRDGVPPQIHVACRRDGGEAGAAGTAGAAADWVLSVKDNGIGIDPEHHERIFMIFQRLHGREKYAGTGIGLSICKKIVEQHGGRIWVESNLGQGSAFCFSIPDKKGH